MITKNEWILTIAVCGIVFFSRVSLAQSDLRTAKEHLQSAMSYSSFGDARAEEEFRKAINLRGGVYPEAWKWLSSYLSERLRFEEAAAALRNYIKQSRQKVYQVHFLRLRRLDRAIELRSRTETSETLSADEMVELTTLVDGFGGKKAAVPYAERAVEQHPESTAALVSLAELIRWEQKDRALELLNRAVAFDPNEPSMYVARGWCYFWAHGDPARSGSDFNKAIELSKGLNASAWAGLGDSLARQGRREEAIAAYRKYLSIRPSSAAHYDGEIRKSIRMLRNRP